MQQTQLLTVRDLGVRLGGLHLVEGVDLDLARGRTHGLVGESGSGKSVTAMAIMRLFDPRLFQVRARRIAFDGRELTDLDNRQMRRIRGAEISMIFQEPMTALNPVLTVGEQIIETLLVHQRLGRAAARRKALEMLEWVRIPAAARRLDEYPHLLSGGMRQRVMIAIAIACRPKLLIADEPTTALDVTIQAQILDLLHELQTEMGMGILLITHDLGVVAGYADEVSVMYAGRIVETGGTAQIYRTPRHPYTEGLIRSHPPVDRDVDELATIPGGVPQPHLRPPGCRFGPRCAHHRAACDLADPPLIGHGGGQRAACIRHADYGAPPAPEAAHG
ncbi:ATP-binding cassette domain-containing protein [Rhodobacteraceae bacterium 2CG4]|uniref:ATP-binding cassette domain-containing protein n=1 Tax=Halovulum marinum TaxID=2662447 RepID=A0A6L5Z442_9RHOB|nr:ABC transporter ATP-binding protein [Halovulum marinum]MSU90764.1 ATP-binding cassette domain-containing protein [Halovulum marinum]